MIPIAIAIFHGIEISDLAFADRTIDKLRSEFSKLTPGVDPERALVIKPVHWAPVLEERQNELLYKLYPDSRPDAFEQLMRLVRSINQGSSRGLLPFAAQLLSRWMPGLKGVRYPGLRWMAMHFVGDIIAYQPDSVNRSNYDSVHDQIAAALKELAAETREDAALCVLAHSYGSVIASDFFYDLRAGKRQGGATPLERGETLSHLYTMGSPMALWSLRYAHGLDRPLQVPAPELPAIHPGLSGEWVNFYDDDDVIAFPLKSISPQYSRAVSRDVKVQLSIPPFSWTPLVHPFYWSQDAVIRPVAGALAATWKQLNQADVARTAA